VFASWTPPSSKRKLILASATTGLLPQYEFCSFLIEALGGQSWEVVLSISGQLDVISAIDARRLVDLPSNVRLNRHAGNFDIMHSSCLYIGQGGQGASLEALFCGIPQILIPPTPFHYSVARRVSELGVGLCLLMAELTADRLRQRIGALLEDEQILQRVKDVSHTMREVSGAEYAANEVEEYLSR